MVTCCVRHWSTKPSRTRAAAYAAHGALGVLLAGIDVYTARRRQDRVITSACIIGCINRARLTAEG